jgi:hypothetical protein
VLRPVVWIVNADHWPRAYLRAELIERGYDAIGFVTLRDAITRLLLARSRRPRLLVIDLHGEVTDDRVRDVLLRERVPVLGIADGAHSAPETRAPFVAILRRPLTIGAIAEAVDGAIGQRPPMGTVVGDRG